MIAGAKVERIEGISLIPAINGEPLKPRTLFWEHEGNRAVLDGDWKMVASRDRPWELYNVSSDRAETTDLAATEPERSIKLEQQWNNWADRVDVKGWQDVRTSQDRYRKNAAKRKKSP